VIGSDKQTSLLLSGIIYEHKSVLAKALIGIGCKGLILTIMLATN